MFELSIAFKYLVPRWRQLSVSIISLISTLVIALVVWLIVVFFSVKDGLEGSWIEKIIALTAPVRMTPTEQYYHSHYYLADTISAASDYTPKTIGEKFAATKTNPHDISSDEEIPKTWPSADIDEKGQLKDLVKIAFNAANNLTGIKGLAVSSYETTFANLRLRLLRNTQHQPSQQFMDNASFLGTFDANTPAMARALIPPTAKGFNNLLHMQGISSDNIQEDSPSSIYQINTAVLHSRLESFFQSISISALKAPVEGWRLPRHLMPTNGTFAVCAILKGDKPIKLILPQSAYQLAQLIDQQKINGLNAVVAELTIKDSIGTVVINGKDSLLSSWIPVIIAADTILKADLIEKSLESAKQPKELKFDVSTTIQGVTIKGIATLGTLEIAEASLKPGNTSSPIAYASADMKGIVLPQDSIFGDPILLPRGFQENGAAIGDQGYLSYYSPTPSSVQEQRTSVYVAGFYDPGIIPIGGKFILAGRELVSLIRSSSHQEEAYFSNGINIRFDNLTDVYKVKAELQKALQDAGVAQYWKISTYQEYEFTKDIIQQLQSEKNLFSLISLVIIVVACSNIISMLIILVNDKKLEIGILRSMGTTSGSIATIFGICGMVMGAAGSLLGILVAVLTLHYINELVGLVSRLQGYDLFNPVFYGNTLPTALSMEALTFVVITTAFISLLAGIVPAVKASMMRPSAILRAE